MKAEYGIFPKPYLECIKALNSVAKEIKIKYMLIGATARDLVMEYVYGIQSPRMTYDIDISIYVDSWDSFEEFKTRLKSRGFTADLRIAQKLTYIASTEELVKLDLVPFGGVSDTGGNIHWPPDGDFKMSVLGFSEAFESITMASVADTEIPVISLEELARDMGNLADTNLKLLTAFKSSFLLEQTI